MSLVLVDYERCDPAQCEDGVCAAVAACTRKLLIQEDPYEPPLANPSLCRGCGDCVRSCPIQAIRVVPG